MLKRWTTTQPTPSLSTAESEMKAITKGCVELFYIQDFLKQQGVGLELIVETDASPAKGALSWLGRGKRMKHIDVQELWIQQIVKTGRIKVVEISTHDNVADFLTKPLDHQSIVKTMQMLNYRYLDTEGEFDDIEEHEMPELEPVEGDELMALLLALVTPQKASSMFVAVYTRVLDVPVFFYFVSCDL